jgi:hypothetical protein
MFDGVPGFRKEDNGLFEVPLRVSEGSGMVWINLDAARISEGSGDGEVREREVVDLFLGLGRKKCRWVDGRTVEGGFNWKSAGEYNRPARAFKNSLTCGTNSQHRYLEYWGPSITDTIPVTYLAGQGS